MSNIEKTIEKYLPKNIDTVTDAMRYSLLGGGKRLRYKFVYAVADTFGREDNQIERIAVAIEMIHAYSLIHDDLPCMDNDDFRRGQPSCHKKYGEANAILAGDALLTLAPSILFGGKQSKSYALACQYIFDCAGAQGMIHGQCVDIAQSPDWYDTCLNKTAKLFMASIVAPAIYLKVNKSRIKELTAFAKNFGLAFQAADDLQEYIVSTEVKQKLTDNLAKYTQQARNSLSKLHVNEGFLLEVLKYLSI